MTTASNDVHRFNQIGVIPGGGKIQFMNRIICSLKIMKQTKKNALMTTFITCVLFLELLDINDVFSLLEKVSASSRRTNIRCLSIDL
jgi:hypothetical protein